MKNIDEIISDINELKEKTNSKVIDNVVKELNKVKKEFMQSQIENISGKFYYRFESNNRFMCFYYIKDAKIYGDYISINGWMFDYLIDGYGRDEGVENMICVKTLKDYNICRYDVFNRDYEEFKPDRDISDIISDNFYVYLDKAKEMLNRIK